MRENTGIYSRMNDFMQAWTVREQDFPRNGSAADKLAFCVRYAVLAPSTYNTQPWHFKVQGNTISVYADRRYALPVIDPDDRALMMTCAGALYALRLAVRHFGYAETTEFLPDPNDENLIARVKLGDALEGKNDPDSEALFKAIPKRHTNRGAFAEKDVPEEHLHALQSAASTENAWLHICTPAERRIITRMVAEADHIQSGDKHFRRELAVWTDPRRALDGDGMAYMGLKYTDVVSSLSPSVARRFETGNRAPANDQDLEQNAPVIAVLGAKSGGLAERLYAGQAMMRVLLQAEALGLSASPMNQPCEVPALRLMLHDELEHQGRAQMIFRFGYGGKPVFSPRRDLSKVLEVDGKAKMAKATSSNGARRKMLDFGKLFARK